VTKDQISSNAAQENPRHPSLHQPITYTA
jgi:hypothetical protein